MRFILLDKVTNLTVGEQISAVKAVSLGEEYLADHFPDYPALPGVLTIEALTQTAAMLVNVSSEFAHSMVILQEARNVKYKRFVRPGSVMCLDVRAKSIGENESSFMGVATVDGDSVAEGRLKLRHFNLADSDEKLADVDARIVAELKRRARLVGACQGAQHR